MTFLPPADPDTEISITPEQFVESLGAQFSAEITRLNTENVSLKMLVDALRLQRDEYADRLRTLIPPLPEDDGEA